MGHRPRYNDKARASKRGDQQTFKACASGGECDKAGNEYSASATPNPDILLPTSERVRPDISELVEPGQKISNTKRKRLEKYIEKKLKKEKRVEIIQQLAESSYASSLLKSSKQLGQGKETLRQQLRQAFLEERAGITTEAAAVGREKLVRVIDADEPILCDEPVADKASLSLEPIVSFGTALKRKTDNNQSCTVSKRKRKAKRSAPRPQEVSPMRNSSSESSDEEPVTETQVDPEINGPAPVEDSAPVVDANNQETGGNATARSDTNTALAPLPLKKVLFRVY